MSSVARDADRRRLEQELHDDDHQDLLNVLQQRHPFLRPFATWDEVVASMRRGTSREPTKDEVLLPILKAHAADRDPHWRTILLVIFWPGLESIWRRKRHWDSDPDALWANILWVFLQTICRLDPSRRSSRLVQKVVNDVFHRLYDEYRREWDRAARQIATDPDELAAVFAVEDGRDVAAAELRDEQEARIAALRAHWEARRIGETDFLLLVGVHVYGRSIADCAREAGLNYEAAKKRHQRATKAIGGIPRPEY